MWVQCLHTGYSDKIQRTLLTNILRRSILPLNSNCFVLPKTNGKKRLITDDMRLATYEMH